MADHLAVGKRESQTSDSRALLRRSAMNLIATAARSLEALSLLLLHSLRRPVSFTASSLSHAAYCPSASRLVVPQLDVVDRVQRYKAASALREAEGAWHRSRTRSRRLCDAVVELHARMIVSTSVERCQPRGGGSKTV